MLQVVATCWASSPGFCCHCFVARFFSCHWWSVFFQDLGSKDINADAYLVAHIVRIGGSHKIINCAQIILWTRDEELLCDNTEEPSCNEPLYNDTSVNRTIFFTPVIVKLMETTLVVANICQFLVPSLKQLESEAANILLEKKILVNDSTHWLHNADVCADLNDAQLYDSKKGQHPPILTSVLVNKRI